MKVVIHPQYRALTSFIHSIPQLFDRDGRSIYKGRNELKCFSVEGVDLVVKSFRQPHLLNRIVYRFFRKSKAFRSYAHSMRIREHGFLCPDPIAYIETKKYGLISLSYYVSSYQTKGEEIRRYMAEYKPEHVALVFDFACFTSRLHQAGIVHLDYSPGNILVIETGAGYAFSLVDLNRVAFRPVSTHEVYANFSRLSTSRDVLTLFATQYATCSAIKDPCFVDKVNKASDDFFKRYTFRLGYKMWREQGGSWFTQPFFRYHWYDWLSRARWMPSDRRKRYLDKRLQLYATALRSVDFRQVFSDITYFFSLFLVASSMP